MIGYIIFSIIVLCLFYFIIRAAVRDGMLLAHKIIHENDKNSNQI